MTNKNKWNDTAVSQGFAHSRDFIQTKQCIKKIIQNVVFKIFPYHKVFLIKSTRSMTFVFL